MGDEREGGMGIAELAQRAGVTPRTVRYYVAEGLLPPPGGRGQRRAYGQGHLDRLDEIRELKAAYLPLHEIRRRLDASSGSVPSRMGDSRGLGMGGRLGEGASVPASQDRQGGSDADGGAADRGCVGRRSGAGRVRGCARGRPDRDLRPAGDGLAAPYAGSWRRAALPRDRRSEPGRGDPAAAPRGRRHPRRAPGPSRGGRAANDDSVRCSAARSPAPGSSSEAGRFASAQARMRTSNVRSTQRPRSWVAVQIDVRAGAEDAFGNPLGPPRSSRHFAKRSRGDPPFGSRGPLLLGDPARAGCRGDRAEAVPGGGGPRRRRSQEDGRTSIIPRRLDWFCASDGTVGGLQRVLRLRRRVPRTCRSTAVSISRDRRLATMDLLSDVEPHARLGIAARLCPEVAGPAPAQWATTRRGDSTETHGGGPRYGASLDDGRQCWSLVVRGRHLDREDGLLLWTKRSMEPA